VNSNPADMLNMASHLTLRKTVNIAGLLGGYYYSRMIKRPVHHSLPVALSIEPTTSCNLRCPQCPSGLRSFSRPTGMMDFDFYKNIIEQVKGHVIYLTLYFQGEPYLNTSFLQMAEYASRRGIYTASSTNAHDLNEDNARQTIESRLDRLIISIDGTTQDAYEKYRIGGSLEKVISGTKNILRWKKKLRSRTPHVVWQLIVMKHNEQQISEIRRLAAETGVDELALKTVQVYDYENGSDLIPSDEKKSRYSLASFAPAWKIKNALLSHCWKMWHSCVITWDGSVVPCCFDKDASYSLGSMK
jgi:MoaA/NifB/PqqE/SkfB family radical SAM enzyme